jgi:hypothetical protein
MYVCMYVCGHVGMIYAHARIVRMYAVTICRYVCVYVCVCVCVVT